MLKVRTVALAAVECQACVEQPPVAQVVQEVPEELVVVVAVVVAVAVVVVVEVAV